MDPAGFSAHTGLKYVGDIQCAPDLPKIVRSTILRYAVVADDLQIGDLRELGRNTVINATGKKCVCSIRRQTFKRQDRDSASRCGARRFALPNHYAKCRS